MPEVCRVDGCDKPIENKKRSLCMPHYYRLWRTGDTGGAIDVEKHCALCGQTFTGQQPNTKLCSVECKKEANRRKAAAKYVHVQPREMTCAECGNPYTGHGAKKYCSKKCARLAAQQRVTATCAATGCGNKVHATGKCKTHYNKTLTSRHKKIEVHCGTCGELTLKEPQKRYKLRFCGEKCRDAHRSEEARLRHSQVAIFKAIPLWHTAHHVYQEPKRSNRVFVSTRCVVCDSTFIDLYGSKTCGEECANTHRRAVSSEAKQRRRARKRAAFIAPVYRAEIYKRDGYTCKLCSDPLRMDKQAPHPLSPSIDHVTALANGGTHEPANVQAAHFLCNAIKGDREWAAA